ARPVSRLDSDELRRYRLHPVLGEQALLASDDMQGVAPVIRAHHERWDGKGFPDGLRGAAIPLGARILAVADAFEDLRSGRINGQALSTQGARHAVLAGRGSEFDPAVVDAFESLYAAAPPKPTAVTLGLPTEELRAGHILAQNFVSPEGVLLLSAGHELNDDLIDRIRSFERKHGLVLKLAVQVAQEASR
ncbi:MAG: HD domain-containing protein, partial [Burkholderiales bacterium]|nr:HD domain-containing protein [Burkholderiales bacterium]